MFPALSTGGGSISAPSSATSRSGDAFSGSGSVTVGGFNPPPFTSDTSKLLALGAVAAALLAAIYLWRR